ncbi:MAG: hypothetical protein ACFFA8_12020 [Promethearchaeota archaeon]
MESYKKEVLKIKLLNIAVIFSIIVSAFYMLMGLLYLISGTFQSYHIDFTGLTVNDVTAFNANLMILIGIFIRMVGIGTTTAGLASLFITIIPFRKGEKWAWVALFLIGIIAIVPTLIITFPVLGATFLYIIFIIMLIIWILGIILSGYEMFLKK